MSARRVKGGGRRGLSGLGIVLVLIGLIALAVTYSVVPPIVPRLWPLILVAVGLFGLLRRPGWVSELDFQLGPEFGRFADRQRRIFSWALVVLGLICLVFTLRLVDERVLGPTVLVVLGLLLLWRRSR
ncbi:MAG TPA: hypothetical protein VIO84_03365 [Candidatus Dormibacteraeota bacterium]